MERIEQGTMQDIEPKYRRPLNIEQVEILELLYKFRFVTVATVKAYFAESNPGMNVFRKLETLEEQGFIAKRYFDNFRLLHKPVVYYLLPSGARKLAEYRDEDDTDAVNIKGIYRDGTVSEGFAMHSVAVLDLYNKLTSKYGDDLDFLSKSDQSSLDNLPKPLPDACVTLEVEDERHYFIDVLDDDGHLLVDASKKIKRYIEYRKRGNWIIVSKAPFPTAVFICNSEESCNKVRKRCEAILNKTWLIDIKFVAAIRDVIELG